MVSTEEEIRQLYMERLAGMFTEADEKRFRALLEHDAHARNVVNLLDEVYKKEDVAGFISSINEEKELENLKTNLPLQNGRQVKRLSLRWISAAVLLLVAGVSVLIFNQKKQTENALTHNTVEKKRGVELKLSDGKVVTLSQDSAARTINIGELKLVTNHNSLQAVQGNVSLAMNKLTVPPVADYQLVLDDGTRVWINSASELSFPFHFSAEKREVTVIGEAYFEVAKDASRPFIVNAGGTKIEVLGTHFNVNAYAGKVVKTSLVEGKVLLSREGAKSVKLSAGYEAEYFTDKGFILNTFDPDNALSWMKGNYYFHNQPLSKIAEVIANWFDKEVVFDQTELKNYEISGLLEKGQLNGFLKDLETSAQVNAYMSGKVLHLNKK